MRSRSHPGSTRCEAHRSDCQRPRRHRGCRLLGRRRQQPGGDVYGFVGPGNIGTDADFGDSNYPSASTRPNAGTIADQLADTVHSCPHTDGLPDATALSDSDGDPRAESLTNAGTERHACASTYAGTHGRPDSIANTGCDADPCGDTPATHPDSTFGSKSDANPKGQPPPRKSRRGPVISIRPRADRRD